MIPIGTTSRQLEAIARWMLVAVALVGMAMWWWPAFASWGAAGGALLAVWALWFLCKIAGVDHRVPGNPVYLALLGPLAVWGYHLARTCLGWAGHSHTPLDGTLNVSAVYQIMLLALTVLLSQGLLARGLGQAWTAFICTAAVTGGAVFTSYVARSSPLNAAAALVGLGGAVAMASFALPRGPAQLERRLAIGAIVAAAVGALAWASPYAVAAAALISAANILLDAAMTQRWRWRLGIPGLVLAAALSLSFLPYKLLGRVLSASLFGTGEGVYNDLNAADSGLAIMLGAIGIVGVLSLVVGCLACSAWLMRASKFGGDSAQGIVWSCAACIATMALLAGGGLFSPAVTAAVGLLWGLAAVQSRRPARRYPGWLVVGILLGCLLLLGMTDTDGVVLWSARAFGYGDPLLHTLAGAFTALGLCWFMGSRRTVWGLVAVAISIAFGGLGEIAQYLASSRDAEWDDFYRHAVGSILVAIPYLLVMGARLQESSAATNEIELEPLR